MNTEKEKVSYIVARQIFDNLSEQKLDLDFEVFTKSILDAAAGKEPAISPAEAQEVMQAFHQKMQAQIQADMAIIAEKNQKEGQEFLAQNAEQDDIHVTESGLQYRIVTEGDGATPTETSTVEVHYEGTLINGEVFDSSYQRGQTIEFPVNGVIPGWTEALQLMKVGAKYELAIPQELAYGPQGAPPNIAPYSTLLFTVELIAVK